MTDAESAALMNDMEFRGRIKVASVRYADSLTIQAVAASSHTSLLRWAAQVFQSPDTVAGTLQPMVVMDGAVQAEGAAIDDEGLQLAVETTVNKLYS
jgi:hypothetical protein